MCDKPFSFSALLRDRLAANHLYGMF